DEPGDARNRSADEDQRRPLHTGLDPLHGLESRAMGGPLEDRRIEVVSANPAPRAGRGQGDRCTDQTGPENGNALTRGHREATPRRPDTRGRPPPAGGTCESASARGRPSTWSPRPGSPARTGGAPAPGPFASPPRRGTPIAGRASR